MLVTFVIVCIVQVLYFGQSRTRSHRKPRVTMCPGCWKLGSGAALVMTDRDYQIQEQDAGFSSIVVWDILTEVRVTGIS